MDMKPNSYLLEELLLTPHDKRGKPSSDGLEAGKAWSNRAEPNHHVGNGIPPLLPGQHQAEVCNILLASPEACHRQFDPVPWLLDVILRRVKSFARCCAASKVCLVTHPCDTALASSGDKLLQAHIALNFCRHQGGTSNPGTGMTGPSGADLSRALILVQELQSSSVELTMLSSSFE